MPKENTHLMFADQVAGNLKDEKLKAAIYENIRYAYIGAVIPDAFLFWQDPEKEKISEDIHGKDGEINRPLISALIKEYAKEKRGEDLAFIFGLITHFALDFIFHPIIIAATGDMSEKDAKKRKEIVFAHQYWETYLDKVVNQKYFVKDLVDANLVRDISIFKNFCQIIGVSKEEGRKTLKRQYLINSLLGIRPVYYLALLLNKIGIVQNNHVKLLEMNLKNFSELKGEEQTIPDLIAYTDAKTGESRKINVADIFDEACLVAVNTANEFLKVMVK